MLAATFVLLFQTAAIPPAQDPQDKARPETQQPAQQRAQQRAQQPERRVSDRPRDDRPRGDTPRANPADRPASKPEPNAPPHRTGEPELRRRKP